MTAHQNPREFPANTRRALANAPLQKTLERIKLGFQMFRMAAMQELPELEAMRSALAAAKDRTLAHLPYYLGQFEERVTANGGKVHWARSAGEANAVISRISRDAGAKRIVKSKSMLTEEIGLNAPLIRDGFDVVETDLGEYIIQLRDEPPSHIIAPAFHLSRADVTAAFRAAHTHLDPARDIDDRKALMREARGVLREKFLTAEVGITGANALIAETGSVCLVTNEGNADLSMTATRVHIVVAGIEKLLPTLDDLALQLRLLGRSATGQRMTVYTTLRSGPRREGETDGPQAFHVVLVDNGRSQLMRKETREVLRCIRCASCLNHCPVYASVGGHAYGVTYPGPIGAAFQPAVSGLAVTHHMPKASSFCGRCEAVCPAKIPLTRIMRHWREQGFGQGVRETPNALALRLYAFAAKRPRLFRAAMRIVGAFWRLPIGPLAAWRKHRTLPPPPSISFVARVNRGKSP